MKLEKVDFKLHGMQKRGKIENLKCAELCAIISSNWSTEINRYMGSEYLEFHKVPLK